MTQTITAPEPVRACIARRPGRLDTVWRCPTRPRLSAIVTARSMKKWRQGGSERLAGRKEPRRSQWLRAVAFNAHADLGVRSSIGDFSFDLILVPRIDQHISRMCTHRESEVADRIEELVSCHAAIIPHTECCAESLCRRRERPGTGTDHRPSPVAQGR